jgi:hypothetical protein
MSHSTLVGLRVISDGGDIERDIVVQESITIFNLHKFIQWSLNPRQSDDGIATTVRIGAILPRPDCRPPFVLRPSNLLQALLQGY